MRNSLVKKSAVHLPNLLITFILDLVLEYMDKLWVFQWELIVHILLICCVFEEKDFMLSLSEENKAYVIEALIQSLTI